MNYTIDVIGMGCQCVTTSLFLAVAWRARKVWAMSKSDVSLALCVAATILAAYSAFVFFHILVRYSLDGWQPFVWGPVAVWFRFMFLTSSFMMYRALYPKK